jgi:hypothetical protein
MTAPAVPKIDEMVDVYIRLRDRRAQRKASFDLDDAKDKGRQEKIEACIMEHFNETGLESARTEAGTAFKSVKISATVADRDSYMPFALEHPEFLPSSVNKSAVDNYLTEHGELPPGVNISRVATINVRRS